MFSDDQFVNTNCEKRDTEFHMFYSECFNNGNTIVQSDLEFDDIYSNNVQKQKIIKDIIVDKYQRRLKIISSMERSR